MWPNQLSRLFRIAFLSTCSAIAAWPIDASRTPSQYVRDKWGADSGFPHGPVYCITQTAGGFLWVGTEQGLVRFDGLNFQLTRSEGQEQPELGRVLGLVVDRDGSMWMRVGRSTLLRRGKREIVYDPRKELGRPFASVYAMAHSRNDSLLLWVLEGEASAIALHGERFETLASPVEFSRSPVLALAQTPNGDIWVGTRDAGLFRMAGRKSLRISDGLPDLKINAITSAGGNELWVGTDGGVVRWDGAKLSTKGIPPSLEGIQALALLVDRDENLWVGTNAKGLARINSHGVSWMKAGPGQENEAVTALFEDREGDLWAGCASGLERLRDSVFITYSAPEAMPSESNGPIYPDREGRLWFAPTQGGLWRLEEGKPERLAEAGLDNDIVYSIAGGRDGLWIGRQHGGLTLLRTGLHSRPAHSSTTFTTAQGLAQNSVYSVYESRDGSVWAGTLSGGVSRLSNGRFTNFTKDQGLPSNTIDAIAETSDGTMWFATPRGLSVFSDSHWRTLGVGDGLPSENINCLLADSGNILWIGTAEGLSFWSAGGVHSPAGMPESLREQILGIAEDQKGSLWLATSAHVVRVNHDKLIKGKLGDGDVREFAPADGLRGTEGVKRSRSVVADQVGRIWFSLNRGISAVDPGRLTQNSVPVIVHIRAMSTDGAVVDVRKPIHIPGGNRRLTLEFGGVSLSFPERIRYRYVLEGFEHDWRGPVATREAVYTNLTPGPYRFHVLASNPDGVWNTHEGVLEFVVDPLLWQTWWFQTALILLCGLTALALYRWRLHEITSRMNLRFEERLAERTRIAQELHDTLLQGFVSVSMQVHVAADILPADSKIKPLLTKALQGMKQVIDEGRNTVRGLRLSRSVSLDLEEAFSQVRQEVDSAADGGVDFRVIVEGQQRPLHPLLRDEVYRIGREGLLNAFRHAHAKHVEIELRYSSSQLQVFVRDDGSGIDSAIAESGRDGHWGLSIMRERAERIGARLQVFSSAAEGTEIELAVPAHLAFEDHSTYWLRWPRKRTGSEEGRKNSDSES
jgi:ligand-binding sensor domain-containing protein/signal transduction histidine kinase